MDNEKKKETRVKAMKWGEECQQKKKKRTQEEVPRIDACFIPRQWRKILDIFNASISFVFHERALKKKGLPESFDVLSFPSKLLFLLIFFLHYFFFFLWTVKLKGKREREVDGSCLKIADNSIVFIKKGTDINSNPASHPGKGNQSLGQMQLFTKERPRAAVAFFGAKVDQIYAPLKCHPSMCCSRSAGTFTVLLHFNNEIHGMVKW